MAIYSKILTVIAMTTLFLGKIDAQEQAIGTSWSFSGIGLTYELKTKPDAFIQLGAQMEMAETFLGRTPYPGISASFTWNNILRTMTSRNGNDIFLFAGAGAAAGYNKDCRLKKKQETYHGGFFGLKGRAGVTIRYDRNINITAAVAPVLGMHLSVKDETIMMRYYRYGLLQVLMPEVTISYRF